MMINHPDHLKGRQNVIWIFFSSNDDITGCVLSKSFFILVSLSHRNIKLHLFSPLRRQHRQLTRNEKEPRPVNDDNRARATSKVRRVLLVFLDEWWRVVGGTWLLRSFPVKSSRSLSPSLSSFSTTSLQTREYPSNCHLFAQKRMCYQWCRQFLFLSLSLSLSISISESIFLLRFSSGDPLFFRSILALVRHYFLCVSSSSSKTENTMLRRNTTPTKSSTEIEAYWYNTATVRLVFLFHLKWIVSMRLTVTCF